MLLRFQRERGSGEITFRDGENALQAAQLCYRDDCFGPLRPSLLDSLNGFGRLRDADPNRGLDAFAGAGITSTVFGTAQRLAIEQPTPNPY